MACKHADLALIYAKQMAVMDEPWKLWEYRVAGNCWGRFSSHFVFCEDWEFRLIPKTIRIGNYDVPEPMREKPVYGTEYWFVDTCERDFVYGTRWSADEYDNIRLKLGICHLTRENCIIHAKALFSFTEAGR